MQYLKRRYYPWRSLLSADASEAEVSSPKSFTFDHVLGAYIVLVVGLVLAAASFFVEKGTAKKNTGDRDRYTQHQGFSQRLTRIAE